MNSAWQSLFYQIYILKQRKKNFLINFISNFFLFVPSPSKHQKPLNYWTINLFINLHQKSSERNERKEGKLYVGKIYSWNDQPTKWGKRGKSFKLKGKKERVLQASHPFFMSPLEIQTEQIFP